MRDAAEPGLERRYDLVAAFETVHDMARPVEALSAMRGMLAPGGTVLVVDERVNDVFTTDAGDIERLYYGFSVLHCLPAAMASRPSAATGTVMRPGTLREY
ncbi:MAG TPA: SAM-dependent methyltransferase, partial [Candidatus Dormibacteraeota bacterium]|nr:SAM-dependent methyltransferase [Candidatus Dormibacteraeota bacterium]